MNSLMINHLRHSNPIHIIPRDNETPAQVAERAARHLGYDYAIARGTRFHIQDVNTGAEIRTWNECHGSIVELGETDCNV